MKKISIIIPCYNVEKYIDRCLNSIVAQTIGLENLEIICVDDCSTDNTLNKLREWEEKYPENIILVTYSKNIRQGGARNVGLQYSSSKYVGFVDSDDWLEPNMYEILYEKMIETGSDLCKCKTVRDSGNGDIAINTEPRKDQFYAFEAVQGFHKYLVPETGNNGTDGGIFCGLYLKERIINNNVFFPESLAYEDNYWTAILNLYIEKLYIVDLVLYHYYFNPNSTITTRNSLHHLDRLIIEPMILEEYKFRGAFNVFKDSLFESFVQRYWLNTLYMLFTRFDILPNSFSLVDMIKTTYKYFPEYIETMKKLPLTLNTKDPNEYLLNLLLVKDSFINKSITDIQQEYLSLWYEYNSPS